MEAHVQDRCEIPPLISHDGNPFPLGLKPIRFDFSPGGFCPVGLPWKEDLSGCERVTEFRYATVPKGWPVLPLYIGRKGPDQTEEQYEIWRRGVEQHHVNLLMLIHHLAQVLATHLGIHRGCRRGLCRRKGRCCGQRDEREVGWFWALFPPCVPDDREIVMTYFDAIREEIKFVAARHKAKLEAEAARGRT